VAELGDDNLVVSTDWPHDDSRFPHAIDTFLKLDLSEETQRKTLWDNCARLYKI
jgi:predicted TIM-barrel fold metal-dependent hydrolase